MQGDVPAGSMTEAIAERHPGPWRAQPEQLSDGRHIAGRTPSVVDATGREVCRMVRWLVETPGADETAEQLAVLFAATPELLAALRQAKDVLDMLGPSRDSNFRAPYVAAWKAVVAAIAKAGGRQP